MSSRLFDHTREEVGTCGRLGSSRGAKLNDGVGARLLLGGGASRDIVSILTCLRG